MCYHHPYCWLKPVHSLADTKCRRPNLYPEFCQHNISRKTATKGEIFLSRHDVNYPAPNTHLEFEFPRTGLENPAPVIFLSAYSRRLSHDWLWPQESGVLKSYIVCIYNKSSLIHMSAKRLPQIIQLCFFWKRSHIKENNTSHNGMQKHIYERINQVQLTTD